MQSLKELGAIVFLVVFYFVAVFFAMAALIPAYYAEQIAFIAAIVAICLFLVLEVTRREEEGMPVALLFMFPFTCIKAGVIWWILRLIGFWEMIR